jgi:phosphoglucosamine mutase
MARFFGTDGVRGVVGDDMTADFAQKLAFAAGHILRKQNPQGGVLIGRDTRASGVMLEQAVAKGLSAAGLEAWLAGIVTTPGVAYLTTVLGALAGVVISASHNPHHYNGIKFFSSAGAKLPDNEEDEIESVFRSLEDELPSTTSGPGCIREIHAETQRYVNYLASPYEGILAGIRVILDCAHGAAFQIAPKVFALAGAEVKCVGASPDGRNINAGCGSLHPKVLQRLVVEESADAGIGFDGDADRVILVDENGNIIDGDHILAIMAAEMKCGGRLPNDLVVGTTLSGLGLEISLRQSGCRLLRAKVGDRYVLEMMRSEGANLGGEPSGHVIFLDRSTTGDGLLSGLSVMEVMAKRGEPLSQLASIMQPLPQVMLNIPLRDNRSWQKDAAIAALLEKLEAELGGNGRLVVRSSGTEPVVRIMVEGINRDQISRVAEQIAAALTGSYGA